jgi:hypothetical protein
MFGIKGEVIWVLEVCEERWPLSILDAVVSHADQQKSRLAPAFLSFIADLGITEPG